MTGRRRLEGVDAIGAALDRNVSIALVLCREAGGRESPSLAVLDLLDRVRSKGIPVLIESAREMRRMSTGGDAVELLALAGPPPARDLGSLMHQEGIVFVLAGLRYPGNVGYILRAAEVAGAAGVVVSGDWKGTQREEALRVSMRADRFFGVVDAEASVAVEAARRAGRRVLAIETGGDRAPWAVDLVEPVAVLVGETTGIPAALLAQVDEVIGIPMRGFIPSYNVQAAVGVLLAEWLRQGAGT